MVLLLMGLMGSPTQKKHGINPSDQDCILARCASNHASSSKPLTHSPDTGWQRWCPRTTPEKRPSIWKGWARIRQHVCCTKGGGVSCLVGQGRVYFHQAGVWRGVVGGAPSCSTTLTSHTRKMLSMVAKWSLQFLLFMPALSLTPLYKCFSSWQIKEWDLCICEVGFLAKRNPFARNLFCKMLFRSYTTAMSSLPPFPIFLFKAILLHLHVLDCFVPS